MNSEKQKNPFYKYGRLWHPIHSTKLREVFILSRTSDYDKISSSQEIRDISDISGFFVQTIFSASGKLLASIQGVRI
jgi:hypothetical protein